MSLLSLLNQTISLYPRSSYGADGREVSGAVTSVQARFQPQRKTRVLPNSEVVTIEATAYVPASTTVEIDDKVTYNGFDYKVFGKYPVPGRHGTTNHIKLELVQWQA